MEGNNDKIPVHINFVFLIMFLIINIFVNNLPIKLLFYGHTCV